MTTTPDYTGVYVHQMRDALIASAVSGQHALLLSAPGWGKTRIARSLAGLIAPHNTIFTRLDASTPPEKVAGMFDPAEAMASPPRIVQVVKGTPYDPDARIVILDELGRPNDVVFDILIDVLDRQDIDPAHAPVVWGTANWMPTSERQEALRDRIALWFWLRPEMLAVGSTVTAHLASLDNGLAIPQDTARPIPDWQAVEAVRAATPGPRATQAVVDLLELLSTEAIKSGFQVNPRRVTQWTRLLYRTGVHYSGDPDFDHLPDKAVACLRYAYPTATVEEWSKWNDVASSVADPLGQAIEAIKIATHARVSELVKSNSSRNTKILEMGDIVAQAETSLKRISATDPRVNEVLDELTGMFANIVSGADAYVKNGS